MKEIMEQYGAAMIAMIVASVIYLLLGTLGADGFWGRTLGTFLSGQSEQLLVERGTASFQSYGQSPVPDIRFANQPLKVGERIDMESCFQVVNPGAGNLKWQLLSLKKENGDVCQVERQASKTYFYFEEPGIYQLCLETSDQYGKKRIVRMNFPVQGR